MTLSHVHSSSASVSPAPVDIPGTVAALRQRFDTGASTSLQWRLRQLEGIVKFVEERERDILDALAADMGRAEMEAYATEPYVVAGEARHALRNLPKWLSPERVSTKALTRPSSAHVHHDPLGVVLIVGPFNYPFQLVMVPLIGALAGGNCALIKPSELSEHTAAMLSALLPKYVDSSCVQVVEGGVDETTSLLEQRFDHIFYTGSARVGRVVMAAAAKHLTPVTLELGGKSPCIVDRTANLEVAAKRIAWGKFINVGQTCLAPDYILVEDVVHDALIGHLKRTIIDFYGEEPQRSPDLARIINERHFDRVTKLLDSGDVVVGGSHDREDKFIAPTVLQNVAEDSRIMQQEIFGPILPVLKVPDVQAAIEFCNRREKPLGLYIFSEDKATQDRIVERVYAGGVTINHIHLHFTEHGLPFGGVGESGMGAYHGKTSFETFTHRKAVMRKGTGFDPPLLYPPYSSKKTEVVPAPHLRASRSDLQ